MFNLFRLSAHCCLLQLYMGVRTYIYVCITHTFNVKLYLLQQKAHILVWYTVGTMRITAFQRCAWFTQNVILFFQNFQKCAFFSIYFKFLKNWKEIRISFIKCKSCQHMWRKLWRKFFLKNLIFGPYILKKPRKSQTTNGG